MILDPQLRARDLTRAEAEKVRTHPRFSRVRGYQERVIDEQNLIG